MSFKSYRKPYITTKANLVSQDIKINMSTNHLVTSS